MAVGERVVTPELMQRMIASFLNAWIAEVEKISNLQWYIIMKSYIFYTFFIKILNYQNELQTHLNVEYVNYFIFKVVSVKNLIFEFRNFNNLLFKMQPISPQPNSKKSKYQLSRSNNKQRTKKKNSH